MKPEITLLEPRLGRLSAVLLRVSWVASGFGTTGARQPTLFYSGFNWTTVLGDEATG